MTLTAPRSSAAPSVRSVRQWMIALGQSVVSMVLGLLLFLVAFGALLAEFHDDPPSALMGLFGLDALLGVPAALAIGPLRFVRSDRAHGLAHLPLIAALGASIWALPAATIALYRLGLRRHLVLSGAALVLVTVTSAAIAALDLRFRGDPLDLYVPATAGVVVVFALTPLLIGHVVGTRRELLVSLRERASAAEREAAAVVRERDAETARVRAEERAALARDMHDSISHHLAAIAMHSGAMAFREDLPPETLRRTAGTVRDAAQRANRELRTVLTGLRTTEGEAPLATAPTLEDIVARCREDGQDVVLRWVDLGPEDLAGRDRSAVVALARILAEVTLNAAKHAPGEPLEVTLSHRDDRVLLRASNPLPRHPAEAPSTGHGLLGVQERTRLLGGDARHGAHDGEFEVEAWMPW